MAVHSITTADFDDVVLNSKKPVVIDFYANWCGPCKMLSPVVDEVSDERDDVLFVKVNVDEEEELAAKFGGEYAPLCTERPPLELLAAWLRRREKAGWRR